MVDGFYFGGRVLTKFLALFNHHCRRSSVLSPLPSTITQPFIGFPVISTGFKIRFDLLTICMAKLILAPYAKFRAESEQSEMMNDF
jgi:hypothetical protein